MPYKDEISLEFQNANILGLDYVEWIVPKGMLNPIMGGFYDQEYIKHFIKIYGINIEAVCLDYLMDLNLGNSEVLSDAINIINWIASIVSNLGVKLLIIPIYDRNLINFMNFNYLIDSAITKFGVKISFEFLDSNSFTGINFINDLIDQAGCCFDIGNNCGRDIIKEMGNYNKYNMLQHIHIKEKDKKGNSVELGKGVIGKVGWKKIFNFLKTIDYRGDFTLQVARGEEGKEVETVNKQVKFIKDLLETSIGWKSK